MIVYRCDSQVAPDVALCVIASYKCHHTTMSLEWRELVADKRRRQLEAIPTDWLITPPADTVLDVTRIPEECGILSARELLITNTTNVDALLEKLASGEWTSVEVTTAFYKRAIVAHQVVNCLTEIFVERALARAAELDAYLKTTGKVIGPLHGLPVSLKDQICIRGLETTMGYVSWIGKYAEKDAAIVEVLHEAGAVPFVRTNVPQTLMWPETLNNVFGRTTNPANRSLTCGGSSGGEGALLAMRGSPLGIGSDIGGSIRIPAICNGLYGLRPSYRRVPYEGCVNSMLGQDSLPSVLGPLSTSLAGVKSFMKAVIQQKPWLKDPLAIRKHWDDDEYALIEHGRGQQLCFAIIWDDGIVVPSPPINRALNIVKDALIKAGHQVIDWKPLKHLELCRTVSAIWNAGADRDFEVTTAPTGEPVIATMNPVDTGVAEAAFRPDTKGISAYELWQVQNFRTELRKEYLDHWLQTTQVTGTGRPVDAIIAPVAPWPAPPHGKYLFASYTMIWNALDYPACTFPVTRVKSELDVQQPRQEFLNAKDKESYEMYDVTKFWNAPVGLQLVGRTMEEEAVIAMMEIVDTALKSSEGLGVARL